MKKNSLKRNRIASAIMSLACTVASAQLAMPVERPELKPGDTWTYRVLDNWTKKETNRYTMVYATEENERWMFRWQGLTDGKTSTLMFNKDLQPCRTLRNSNSPVCGGTMKFPLTEAGKHSFKELPWSNGNGHYSADCEVKGIETVEVPAGKFEAVKIACKGFWTRLFEGSSSGRFDQTVWYAPSIRQQVKNEYNDLYSNGQPNVRNLTELVEFKPAP